MKAHRFVGLTLHLLIAILLLGPSPAGAQTHVGVSGDEPTDLYAESLVIVIYQDHEEPSLFMVEQTLNLKTYPDANFTHNVTFTMFHPMYSSVYLNDIYQLEPVEVENTHSLIAQIPKDLNVSFNDFNITMNYAVGFDGPIEFEFETTFETESIYLIVYPTSDYIAEGLGIPLNPTQAMGFENAYVAPHDPAYFASYGDTFGVRISKEQESQSDSYNTAIFALLFLTLISISVIYFIIRKKPEPKVVPSAPTKRKVRSQKAASDTSELADRKKTLLKALKRLRADHKDGTLDDETFKEMETDYKKRIIKIMKNIDEEKGE